MLVTHYNAVPVGVRHYVCEDAKAYKKAETVFCVCRCPFRRAISLWDDIVYRKRNNIPERNPIIGQLTSFSEYLSVLGDFANRPQPIRPKKLQDMHWFIEKIPVPHTVLKFENLVQDLNKLPFINDVASKLPHKHNSKRASFDELIPDILKKSKQFAHYCMRDSLAFDYDFDSFIESIR